jgi:hypothetical protein
MHMPYSRYGTQVVGIPTIDLVPVQMVVGTCSTCIYDLLDLDLAS